MLEGSESWHVTCDMFCVQILPYLLLALLLYFLKRCDGLCRNSSAVVRIFEYPLIVRQAGLEVFWELNRL